MLEMDSVIADLKDRVSVLEREEPQYKGFKIDWRKLLCLIYLNGRLSFSALYSY